MVQKNKKKNFFLLLDLDPNEPWDQAKFEQVLAKKKSEWNKLRTGISTKAREAQRKLEMVSEIQKTLTDPTLRDLEAQAAKEELATLRDDKRSQFMNQLELEQSKGYLYQKELQKLNEEFSDVYSKQEILDHVKVSIIKNSPEIGEEQQQPELTIATEIAERLKFLDLGSLYDLVDQPQSLPTSELEKAAQKLSEEMARRRPETIEVKEKKELAGYAIDIFSSEEKRKKYDENLRQFSLNPLFKYLDTSLEDNPVKELYTEQIEWFLKKAGESGLSKDEAISRLKNHARRRNWTLPPEPWDKQARIKQNADSLRKLISNKNHYEAHDFLKGLKPGEIDDRQRYQKEIDTGIARADELVKRAQSRFIGQEAKIHYCRMALGFCADCKEAYGILSANLPAPRNLEIFADDMAVTLTWEPSFPDASYKVIRKSDSQPHLDDDGIHLGTFTECVFDDREPEIGIPTFYAVFTVCDDVVSIDGAILRKPIFIMPEITNESVHVDNQRVELSWHVPPNVHSIVVLRKEKTSPKTIHDGILLPLSADIITHLVDTQVQNNSTYYYLIYCRFVDYDGSLVNTQGKVISAVPEAIPEVIRQLDIQRTQLTNGFEIVISWEQPITDNKVILLKSRRQVESEHAKPIPVSQLSQYGEEIRGDGNRRRDIWPGVGIGYYTPIIISRNMAYPGPSHLCYCGEDVTELKCQIFGVSLRLEWKWPEHCKEVAIYFSNKDYPQPQSPEAIVSTHILTRKEYEYFRFFEMNGTTGQHYYIAVSAIREYEGKRIFTPGDRIQVYLQPRMVIDYEIKHQRFGRNKRILHLTTQTSGVPLTSFRLVSQRHRLPTTKYDGETFFQWTGYIELEDECSFALPEIEEVLQDTFVRLFLEDDAAYEFVDVRPPAKEKLRLR